MLEFLQTFLAGKESTIVMTLAIVYGTNAVLTGVKKMLGRIKDKTESQVDDKIYGVLDKVVGAVDKVIEFLTANSQALPGKAKEELEKKD